MAIIQDQLKPVICGEVTNYGKWSFLLPNINSINYPRLAVIHAHVLKKYTYIKQPTLIYCHIYIILSSVCLWPALAQPMGRTYYIYILLCIFC